MIVFLGFGREMLEWVKSNLIRDTSQKAMRFVGAPSSLNDWGDLYKKGALSEAVQLIRREAQSCLPHRILVLYVPSRNDQRLVSTLGVVCFLPLSNQIPRKLPITAIPLRGDTIK